MIDVFNIITLNEYRYCLERRTNANCLVYVTHRMESETGVFLSFLKRAVKGIMDILVLYDGSCQSFCQTDYPEIIFCFFDSCCLKNFFHQGNRLLPNPLVALVECVKQHHYDHYLLMENDIVLNGNFRSFIQRINEESTVDYIHIATDVLGSPKEHWPIRYIVNNPFGEARFAWSQLFYVSFRFLQDLEAFMRRNGSFYYEFLLPTMAYHGNYTVRQFENYGYQFQVSWGPAAEYEEMYQHHRTLNTFYHPIKTLDIVNWEMYNCPKSADDLSRF